MTKRSTGAEKHVVDGERLAVKLLREAADAGLSVLDVTLVLVFDGFQYAPRDLPRLPGHRWRVDWLPRGAVGEHDDHVDLSHAVVALGIRDHSRVLGIAPGRLLPRGPTVQPSPASAHLLGTYYAGVDDADDRQLARARAARRRIHTVTAAELERAPPRRTFLQVADAVATALIERARHHMDEARGSEDERGLIDAELDRMAAEDARAEAETQVGNDGPPGVGQPRIRVRAGTDAAGCAEKEDGARLLVVSRLARRRR